MRRIQVRSEQTLRGSKLGGYAAVFDQVALQTGMGPEKVAPGAFDIALRGSDVRALYNHDPLYVLGRQSAGTLRLSLDTTGLEYEVDLPDTSYARDLRELVDRGDITGTSFAFVPGEFTYDPETRVTTHTAIRALSDVSPVTYPAYVGATTETRSASGTSRRSQLIRARARITWRGETK